MFNFIFIKKYKTAVESYVERVLDTTALSYVVRNTCSNTDFKYSDRNNVSTKDGNDTDSGNTSKPAVLYSMRSASKDDESLKRVKVPHPMEVDKYTSEGAVEYVRDFVMSKKNDADIKPVTDLTFVEKLLILIRESGFTEPSVYKSAHIDRRLFSKIISNNWYQPSKDTAIAFVFALNLSLEDAKDLLNRAGYTLSHSLKRDIVLEFFIKEKIYNLNNINAILDDMGEKVIGRK
jgi:hypothetical protein